MADRVTLRIDGLDTIETALRTLPRHVQSVVLAQALTAGSEVIRTGIAAKIHSRTGKTAADLHTEIQVKPDDVAGLATVGATRNKKSGRDFVMHFLEIGTKPHKEPKKLKSQTRRGKSFTEARLVFALTQVAKFKPRKRLAFGGRVFSSVKHPGTHAQAPMRQTVAQQGIAAVNAFSRAAWDGIRSHMERA